jgi:hypothetical protein
VGNKIFLVFPALMSGTPIRAHIRTVVPWGIGQQIPGIGVKFENLSVSQVAALDDICRSDGR